jgi:hypothetical protein
VDDHLARLLVVAAERDLVRVGEDELRRFPRLRGMPPMSDLGFEAVA